MIQVQIGGTKKKLEDAQPRWINEQLARRRRDGESDCVRVWIQKAQVDIVLSTPSCPSAGVGNRGLNSREEEIRDLWTKRSLNASDFTGGSLIAFLKQVS